MDVDKYLLRLNCLHLKNAKPNLDTLKELQKHHLEVFPFENFDMHGPNKKHINLSFEEAYNKMIIHENRGGYCLELNGLFSWLLGQMGYNYYFLPCHVYYGMLKKFSTALTHAFLIVIINDKHYYVDVGTSRFQREPIELKFDAIQRQYLGTHRFIKESNNSDYVILQRTNNAHAYDEHTEWFDQIKFKNNPVSFNDLYQLNEDVQSMLHPMVYCKTFCAKHTTNSVIILIGRTFSEIKFEENNQTRVDSKGLSDDEIKSLIRERFHLYIDDTFEPVDEPYDDV